jgi:hypothetical protein
MSLPVLAQHMAAKGRGQDSMLVHMTPQEVAGLHALAIKHGGTLTINPETGLVEAGFLSSILPMVAGFALDAFLPGVGSAIGGALGTSAAVGTGIAVGGFTGLATGSLSKGLMAGLGAYGGAGLSQGLLGAGASALGTDAFNAANTLNAGMNPAAVEAAVQDKIANASFSDKLAAGFDATKANPMGFIKPNAGYLAAAAAPVIADQMVPTTVKAPPLPPAYIRPFQFDQNTRKVTAQTPVLASEWGDRSFPDMIPKSFDQGGIVALAGGGDTKTDPYAKYNTLSGTSKAAYDYLMGNSGAGTPDPYVPRTLTCPAGFHLENGACVLDAATVVKPPVTGGGCGPGYHEQNGVCVPDIVLDNSCPVGQTRNAAGVCVADKVTDTSCPVGTHDDGAGNCIPNTKDTSCPVGQTRNAAGVCVATAVDNSCPVGQTRNAAGVCVATAVDNSCPVGQTRNAAGVCVATAVDNSCPVGQTRNAAGVCVATAVDNSCPVGQTRNAAGVCVATETDKSCPVGQTRNAAGICVANETDKSCPVGQERNAAGVCVAKDGGDGGSCPVGQTRNAAGICVNTVTETACPAGQTRVNGICVIDTSIVTLPGTGIPGTGTPGDGTPGSGTPGSGTPGSGTPGSGTPGSGTPGSGTPGSGTPADGTPGSGLTVVTGTPGSGTPGSSTATKSTDTTGIAALTGGDSGTGGGTMGGDLTTKDRQFGDYTTDLTAPTDLTKVLGNKIWGTVDVTPTGAQNDLFSVPGQYIGGYYAFTEPGTGGSGTQIAVPEGTVVTDRMGNSYPAGLPGIMNTPSSSGGAAKITDDELMSGRMAFAGGGMPSYALGGLGDLGGYSDGGRLLRGPGDGVSDSIPATIGSKGQPARLADGEFVIPARIVSELGNGSTDAGARKLYAMMDRIQKSRGKTVGKGKVAANSRADKHLPA